MNVFSITATRWSLCITVACFVGSVVAQERSLAPETQLLSTIEQDISGVWVTNQGMLELSQTGDELSGTLDGKTKVSGNVTAGTVSLQYKRTVRPIEVTLRLSELGRWISGASKKGTKWFGCREKSAENDGPGPAADFSGHWLFSWGIMQLTQASDEVQGSYGADGFGKLEGAVVGRRFNFQWKRHRGKGNGWIEQSPDGKQLIGQTTGTDKPAVINGLRADRYEYHVPPTAGEMVRGRSDSGMLYHLRMPDDWKQGDETDVVVLFHGSNFTTAGMVSVMARKWPDIARRFAILGIQGERWAKWSSADDLRFNYTYASWVGRSTYRGYPFTDRESPALVMELIDELHKQHQFGRIFAGGHSQGGFLTYMLHMHFPEKLAGAFPIAGGIPFQSEPRAFDDKALMAAQRATPMVIVHGTRDRVVRFSSSTYAYQKFLAHGFPLVKRLSPNADHPFDFLPIGEAVQWLAAVTTSDPIILRNWADERVDNRDWRDVGAAIERARTIGAEEELEESIKAFEAAASENAAEHLDAIQSNTDGSWIDAFLGWQEQFIASDAAESVDEAFNQLQTEHAKEASRLESEARKAFRERKTDEGWELYRKIVDEHYASPQYRTLKERVKKHFVVTPPPD